MDLKVPAGGVVSPLAPLPQHLMVPSVFSPQAKSQPVLTEVKAPGGGKVSPKVSPPQQKRVLSVLTAQA
jgi:hypothetical protein